MYYITKFRKKQNKQIDWSDILFEEVDIDFINSEKQLANTSTITYCKAEIKNRPNVDFMIKRLEQFNETFSRVREQERTSQYSTFYIPKKTGGLRRIDAPNDDLKYALNVLKTVFENEFGCLYHTSAFAYVKGRSIVDAVKKHQWNNSNWFMKTDFSGFFPSTTKNFVIKQFKKIVPLCFIINNPKGMEEMNKALDLCFLNGGLPQGTPMSPMLTNLVCIPIDYELFNYFAHKRIIYTRYADDMIFSCKQTFNQNEVINKINNVLAEYEAPWKIKNEKTHYGSKNGRNWCLGLMLNRDNKITIGSKRKKEFEAMLCNIMTCPEKWSNDEKNHLNGLISYYKMIEKNYIEYLIRSYEKKFNKKLKQLLKTN